MFSTILLSKSKTSKFLMAKLYLLVDKVLFQYKAELYNIAKVILSFKHQIVITSQCFFLLPQSLLVWKDAVVFRQPAPCGGRAALGSSDSALFR